MCVIQPIFLETYRERSSLLCNPLCSIFVFCLFPFSLLVLLQMGMLLGLTVHGYHQSVLLKILPIQQSIFRPQVGSTPLGDVSIVYPRDRQCDLFWVHFNLSAKRLNITRQMASGILSPRVFIITIIVIIMIIIIIRIITIMLV